MCVCVGGESRKGGNKKRENVCVFKSICAPPRFKADTAGFCRIREPIFSESMSENLMVYLSSLFPARSLWIILTSLHAGAILQEP